MSHNFDGVSKYLFADKAKNQKFDSKKSYVTLHYI